jgi:hypothetical protein
MDTSSSGSDSDSSDSDDDDDNDRIINFHAEKLLNDFYFYLFCQEACELSNVHPPKKKKKANEHRDHEGCIPRKPWKPSSYWLEEKILPIMIWYGISVESVSYVFKSSIDLI